MKFNNVMAVLIALLLVTTMVPAAFAAGSNEVEGAAGEKVTVTFDINNAYGVNGTFDTNGNGADYSSNGAMTGSVNNDKAFFYGDGQQNLQINAEVTIPADAKPGDRIPVTFTYEVSDANGDMSEMKTVTQYIVVGEDVPTPTEAPTQPTQPSQPSQPSGPSGGGNKEEEKKIDYTELNKQIAIAESLKEADYTAESWAAMLEKLEAAIEARKSDDQDVVDKAARELAAAIAALVKIDASKLEQVIAEGNALAAGDKLGNLWFQLFEAIQEGIDLIGSGDQAAVDAAVAKIEGLIAQIKAALAEQGEVAVKEVIVEVEPEGEYCNLAKHRIWPILFFVSLAVNVLLAVVLIVVLKKRKAVTADDTPLVDYDIGEDI